MALAKGWNNTRGSRWNQSQNRGWSRYWAPTQNFNDGACVIYGVKNASERGMLPGSSLVVKYEYLRYAKRVVGMGRYWGARQNNVVVDMLIRVQLLTDISTQDVIVMEDGTQFNILQIQQILDQVPPFMDLSLQRRVDVYDITSVSEPDINTAGND